jgi:fucose 4-O-acetylase-like acetyltransferase
VRLPPPPPIAQAAAATGPDHDRVLDLLRAMALALVVLGHSSMGVIGWSQDGPEVSTALDAYHPWASWATWLLQIMPLFFVAGGAANARSWRATGLPYSAWLWRRVARLMRPVWVYLLIMAPLAGVVSLLVPTTWSAPLLGLTTQLLWFVGVYLGVCALTPLLVRAHDRSRLLAPVALLASVAAVDVARIGAGVAPVGLLNFVLAWAFAASLGLLLDGGLLGRWRGLAVCAAAVAANLALIRWGPYPISMVGGSPGERFSNMAPPSLALALHALALAGLAGLARPGLARLAGVDPVWRAVTAINLTAMTLYLWHLPVLITMSTASHLLGLDRPVTWGADGQPQPGPGYWLWTLLFLAVDLACVAVVVRVLWVAEVGRLPGWDAPARTGPPAHGSERRATALAALGTATIGIGTLVLAATGLAGFPTRVTSFSGVPLNAATAMLLMLGGGLLVRSSGAASRHGGQQGPTAHTFGPQWQERIPIVEGEDYHRGHER